MMTTYYKLQQFVTWWNAWRDDPITDGGIPTAGQAQRILWHERRKHPDRRYRVVRMQETVMEDRDENLL